MARFTPLFEACLRSQPTFRQIVILQRLRESQLDVLGSSDIDPELDVKPYSGQGKIDQEMAAYAALVRITRRGRVIDG